VWPAPIIAELDRNNAVVSSFADDASKEELEKAFEEWKQSGEPRHGNK
jgi:hypothetical protein